MRGNAMKLTREKIERVRNEIRKRGEFQNLSLWIGMEREKHVRVALSALKTLDMSLIFSRQSD